MTAVPKQAPTLPIKQMKSRRSWPAKPSQGTWAGHSRASQPRSTSLGREGYFPKGKVLVWWLRKLEVPQLSLPARDIRKVSPGARNLKLVAALGLD